MVITHVIQGRLKALSNVSYLWLARLGFKLWSWFLPIPLLTSLGKSATKSGILMVGEHLCCHHCYMVGVALGSVYSPVSLQKCRPWELRSTAIMLLVKTRDYFILPHRWTGSEWTNVSWGKLQHLIPTQGYNTFRSFYLSKNFWLLPRLSERPFSLSLSTPLCPICMQLLSGLNSNMSLIPRGTFFHTLISLQLAPHVLSLRYTLNVVWLFKLMLHFAVDGRPRMEGIWEFMPLFNTSVTCNRCQHYTRFWGLWNN